LRVAALGPGGGARGWWRLELDLAAPRASSGVFARERTRGRAKTPDDRAGGEMVERRGAWDLGPAGGAALGDEGWFGKDRGGWGTTRAALNKLRDLARWSYIALCACRQMNWRQSGFGLVLATGGGGGPRARDGGALGGAWRGPVRRARGHGRRLPAGECLDRGGPHGRLRAAWRCERPPGGPRVRCGRRGGLGGPEHAQRRHLTDGLSPRASGRRDGTRPSWSSSGSKLRDASVLTPTFSG
jgi:hypothetical protein